MDWDGLRQRFEDYSFEAVITLLVGAVLTWAARRLWPHIHNWLKTNARLRARIVVLKAQITKLQMRIQRALDAVARVKAKQHSHEGRGLWLTTPIQQPAPYFSFPKGRCVPIWVFANLKGGVAKTTNAANLAGHYALSGEKVLLIDLDYQASATAMALRDNQRSVEGHDCRATQLIDGRYTTAMLLDARTTPTVDKEGLVKMPNLSVIPAAWDLADAENRLMVEWLLKKRNEDIRYTIARLLHDPNVQANFQRIIIDAPPRLTTACVQALCTATHVVIPTVLDQLSAEAVHNFIFQVKRLKDGAICPHIEFGPVIGYRSGNATGHISKVEDAIALTLRRAELSEDLYRREEVIPHKPLLAESAGRVIAVLRNDKPTPTLAVREMYDRLASSIEQRVK